MSGCFQKESVLVNARGSLDPDGLNCTCKFDELCRDDSCHLILSCVDCCSTCWSHVTRLGDPSAQTHIPYPSVIKNELSLAYQESRLQRLKRLCT